MCTAVSTRFCRQSYPLLCQSSLLLADLTVNCWRESLYDPNQKCRGRAQPRSSICNAYPSLFHYTDVELTNGMNLSTRSKSLFLAIIFVISFEFNRVTSSSSMLRNISPTCTFPARILVDRTAGTWVGPLLLLPPPAPPPPLPPLMDDFVLDSNMPNLPGGVYLCKIFDTRGSIPFGAQIHLDFRSARPFFVQNHMSKIASCFLL